MPFLPNNVDPLKDYVTGGALPPLTIDGLVYNKVYAQTGVIDTVGAVLQNGYTDPNSNIINGQNNFGKFGQTQESSWISRQDFGGPDSVPVVLTYNFNTETDLNIVSFQVLNVPCFVELGYYNDNNAWVALPGSSTFVVNGNNDIFNYDNFLHLEYMAPETLSLGSISLRITRNQPVQTINNGIFTNVAYSIGVQSFHVNLQVIQSSDIPPNVTNGSQAIITQNRLGFIEDYNYINYPVSNIFTNDNKYWKCSPQPTGDSIVYFYACIADNGTANPTPKTINRLYIDPLYSGCRFNVYATTNGTLGGTIDPDTFTWTPIQRDFTLRKGIYELPPVAATYLKFEFVKLIAEPYDLSIDSITRTINVFPASIEEYYYQLENAIIDGNSVQYSHIGNNNNPQTITSTNINSSTLFGLSSNTIANANTWPQLSALNNSQLGGNTTTVANNTNSYIIDPTMSYKTINSDGTYNGVAYNQFLQRRFMNVQQHSYTQTTINQCWHEAYFTGIQYLTAFYEKQFDDIRILPTELKGVDADAFVQQNNVAAVLNASEPVYVDWQPTLEKFNSFNIGALTSEWQSFLTDNQVLMNDPVVLNDNLLTNCTATTIGQLGSSSIISISGNLLGFPYSIQSTSYPVSYNELVYDDANFSEIDLWTASGTTTITSTPVIYVSGTSAKTVSGLSISGGNHTAMFRFDIPNVDYGGKQAYTLQFGTPDMGTVGFGSYNPITSGTNYYFYTGVQVSGTASGISTTNSTISARTQFYNSFTNTVISGTVFSGSNVAFVSGTGSNIGYVTSTNYTTSGVPAGSIQFVVSGTTNYNLYQLGVFPTPTTNWQTPQDRKYMRVSSIGRIMLPFTNLGSYRFCLCAFAADGTEIQLTCQDYGPGEIPLATWFEQRLEAFTYTQYTDFFTKILQIDITINEVFYVNALAPFYHPIKYEYTTISGSNYPDNYQYITGDINNPNYFVTATSGIPASGIQLRMTALDPDVFISGISLIPYYKSNPYYADINIDYAGNSKTNQLSARTAVIDKPFFQSSSLFYPTRFTLPVVVGPNVGYITSNFGY